MSRAWKCLQNSAAKGNVRRIFEKAIRAKAKYNAWKSVQSSCWDHCGVVIICTTRWDRNELCVLPRCVSCSIHYLPAGHTIFTRNSTPPLIIFLHFWWFIKPLSRWSLKFFAFATRSPYFGSKQYISDVSPSACPSMSHQYRDGCPRMDFRAFRLGDLLNLSRKFKFGWNRRKNWTLYVKAYVYLWLVLFLALNGCCR